jgi:hypothetical protein
MMPSSDPASRPWLYALFPFVAYLLSWYYNGQIIPLLALSMMVMLAWGVWVWWPRLRAGLPWPRGFLPAFMLLWLLWFGLTLFWSGVLYSSWFYFWVLGSLPLWFLIWVTMQDAGCRMPCRSRLGHGCGGGPWPVRGKTVHLTGACGGCGRLMRIANSA